MSTDHYMVLGLPKNASGNRVRSRFQELARTRHPDRFSGEKKALAESAFQEITEAYNVLRDVQKRREYDMQAARPVQHQNEKARLAQVYLKMGTEAFKGGRFEQAAENFRRATTEEPDNARAWHFLAKACQREGSSISRTLSAADRACRLEPMNATYLEFAGDVSREDGQKARAEGYYRKALTWGGDETKIEESLKALQSTGGKGRIGLLGKGS